ncbi:MAG: 4Fe-4S binding protein [Phycisphaerae bacterium]|nr:4Fe-4S binding protein [Phycisphaerae bacterium]
MRITTVRRICQVFFLVMLGWFAVVTVVGPSWWQMRNWPVNWLLQLDPLVAVGTVLATGTLYAGLIWAAATVVATVLLGRFFCGWVCPFGTVHQFFGWLGRRARPVQQRIEANRYRRWQSLKYYLLAAMLATAVVRPGVLVTGWLDPIPLVHRSVTLVVLPLADAGTRALSPAPRLVEWSWLIGAVFLAAVAANFFVPRFYCRFVCPLGALLGVLGRWALFRIGKSTPQCSQCGLCEADCEGACNPSGQIRTAECVLCCNCLAVCPDDVLRYGPAKSAAGERTGPDVSRRGVLLSLVAGAAAGPLLRLAGRTGASWNSAIIRPPGALDEERFLQRCIRCGQCMKICPTNVLQPGGLQGGLETLWTPMLNNRIGTSARQLRCIACSSVCPTRAIRPISLDERLGRGAFASAGPIRLGAAFVDRGRCLPWAMDRPCIVCQENCPVSPKAITVREQFSTVRGGSGRIQAVRGTTVELNGVALRKGELGTGDYYLACGGRRLPIVGNDAASVTVAEAAPLPPGAAAEVQVRLQQPVVDPRLCIGCGVCEHECPVSGLRAIRVTAENESRSRKHSLLP